MLLKKYFNYPVTTEVSSKHEAITDFPSVTICNFNIIRKSVAKANGSDQLFYQYFKSIIQGTVSTESIFNPLPS